MKTHILSGLHLSTVELRAFQVARKIIQFDMVFVMLSKHINHEQSPGWFHSNVDIFFVSTLLKNNEQLTFIDKTKKSYLLIFLRKSYLKCDHQL